MTAFGSQPQHVQWLDDGREPQCPPDPNFPNGKPVDCAWKEDGPICEVALPCPAPRCGIFVVTCLSCGHTTAITTAGRPDDPNHFRTSCPGRVVNPHLQGRAWSPSPNSPLGRRDRYLLVDGRLEKVSNQD